MLVDGADGLADSAHSCAARCLGSGAAGYQEYKT
jgi:hypothetical protein